MSRYDPDSMIQMDAAFHEKVYAEVAKIPLGRVTTYGKIAERIGFPNAGREVGIAMSRTPNRLQLPCHRVVNKTGTLAPAYAFGSQAHQRNMLKEEGITFLPDGRIHMDRHMWPDDPQGEQLSMF